MVSWLTVCECNPIVKIVLVKLAHTQSEALPHQPS